MKIVEMRWEKGELYIYIKAGKLKDMEFEDYERNILHQIDMEDILDHVADETGIFIIEV